MRRALAARRVLWSRGETRSRILGPARRLSDDSSATTANNNAELSATMKKVASTAEVEKAIGALQYAAVRRSPEKPARRRQLRHELSEQSLDDALETSKELRSLAADAYGSSGSSRRTRFLYSEACAGNPIFAAALSDSGLVHKGRGEFETAAKYFVEVLRRRLSQR